jgi:ElaB/YqjD/DUF883 family membrane-anchored ribosome-binding protein
MAIPLRGNDPSVPEIPEDTEARSSSADVPTYDTYPAEPPRGVDWKGRQERWREFESRNPRLNETAEKIGSAVGDMVNRAQEARRRFDSVKQDIGQSSGSKVEELRQRAQEKWSTAAEAAQERLQGWKQTARESAEEARDAIMQRTREARMKARAYVDENPHHVILGIAGAAFAIGLTARIWRSQRG